MKKPLLLIACTAMILVLLCVSGGLAVGYFMRGRGFSPVTLAVADETENSLLPQAMSFLGGMEDIRSYARLRMASPEDARDWVAKGNAAAALIFPDGFLDSVFSGENFSPVLVLDAERPLEVLALSLLAESAGSLLTSAQKGIAFTRAVYEYVRPPGPDFNRMIWDINGKYAQWAIRRSELYQIQSAAPVGGALAPAQHYLLSFLLFFCMFAPTGLLYPVFSWQRQQTWLRRLRGAGGQLRDADRRLRGAEGLRSGTGGLLTGYALAQVLWGAAAVFALLTLTTGGLTVAAGWITSDLALSLPSRFSPHLFFPLLLIALFISAFTFLCCNAGPVVTSVTLSFVLTGVFLTASGGLVPSTLLPEWVNALAPLSPLTWMRALLSGLFVSAPAFSSALSGIKLLSATAFLLAFISGFCRDVKKQGGAGR